MPPRSRRRRRQPDFRVIRYSRSGALNAARLHSGSSHCCKPAGRRAAGLPPVRLTSHGPGRSPGRSPRPAQAQASLRTGTAVPGRDTAFEFYMIARR